MKARLNDALLDILISAFLTAIIIVFIPFIDPVITRGVPALLFLPVVFVASWYGGIRTGTLTVLFSSLAIYFIYLPSISSFYNAIILPFTQLSLFIAEGLLISFFIDRGKRDKKIIDFKKRETELLKKINILEQEQEKARGEIQSRDEFLSLASHELKTPLTSMLLQTQSALHNIRSVSLANFSIESLLKMLESAENQTKRLSKMINDMLNVSLITTGRMELEIEEVNLADTVREVMDEFFERIKRDNYHISLDLDQNIVGKWDKLRVEQAVTNLLSNALKYGKKKPIEIIVRKIGDSAQLIVRDQGIGIPSDQQDRIFGLFERAVSHNSFKGLGVGLYITSQIVKTHNGTIKVKSKRDNGSTFTITLPLHVHKTM